VIYLLDSDRLIDYLRGRLDAIALVDQLQPDGIALSVVTIAEVMEGIQRDPARVAREAAFGQVIRGFTLLAIDEPVARRFAALRGHLRDVGRTIGDLDTMIAATALHHDLTLVTRNRRHFERVPDLKIHRDP